MKIALQLLLMFALVSCNKTHDRNGVTQNDQEMAQPIHKSWHVTEGLDSDPVSLPSCSLERVKKLKIGDSLDSVQTIVGHLAVPYYDQKDFSILHTPDLADSDYYWEVALLHGEGNEITDISFKKISIDSSL